MNKRDFNVVGNEGTDNQELAKGIAFVKSSRAPLNVALMVMEMNTKTIPNGVLLDTAYCDNSRTLDYDRDDLNGFFEMLKNNDVEVTLMDSLLCWKNMI